MMSNTLWAIFVLVIISPAQAYVTPKIGGGQQGGFPMIMPEYFLQRPKCSCV